MHAGRESLVLRADADTAIGIGHVVRCLALAQAWQDRGGRAVLASALGAPALAVPAEAAGVKVVELSTRRGSCDDAAQLAKLARRLEARWVVVDGDDFDSDYQRHLRECGLRVLLIDDTGRLDCHHVDIVLNQNIHAHPGMYPQDVARTRLLLGPRYALLRRDFEKWWTWRRSIPPVATKVLVTLGGGDPANATEKVVQALDHVRGEGLEVVVLIGGTNPHAELVRRAVENSRWAARVECNIMDMAALMAWADLAVAAGGSTSWELAFMGLPSVVLVLFDNQEAIATGLEQAGVAINLGWYHRLSAPEITRAIDDLRGAAAARAEMSRRGRTLVDGDGRRRVVEILSAAA